jgi:hypothetical protein
VQDKTGQPEPELRVALFTGNYNYIKDGVALTLNRLVAFLESRGVPVLVFAPVAETPAFESAGELVPVPSFAIPTRSEYRIASRRRRGSGWLPSGRRCSTSPFPTFWAIRR